jgi:hypothetical protein
MFLGIWGEYGTGEGQFEAPCDVGSDGNGDIYVVDMDARVQKFGYGPVPANSVTWGRLKADFR